MIVCVWWSSACATCEYHDSDFDELTNKEDEWCEKGYDGLKGFPFQKSEMLCRMHMEGS